MTRAPSTTGDLRRGRAGRTLTALLVVLLVVEAVRTVAATPAPELPVAFPKVEVDLARAPIARLELLPGIGPRRAAAIVAARATGRIERAADLIRVHGIGPDTLDGIRSVRTVRVTVNGRPIQGAGSMPP